MRGWLREAGREPGVAFVGELHRRAAGGPGTASGDVAAAEVLAAWRRLGPRMGSALNGVFVAALRDGDSRLLYRAASSLQNLYWTDVPGAGIAYASELPELFAMAGVPCRLAPSALHEYLRFLDVAAPRTLFEGVSALEPGRLLRARADGSVHVEQPDDPSETGSPIEFDAAVDQLDTALRESIAIRLAGCSRPALFLSSGVDSTLIAAIAATLRPDTTAITVGFDEAGFDEAPQAAAIARRLGLPHRVLRFGHAELLSAFERCAAGMEQPTADPSLPATVLALDHCRQHFDAVLEGTGADEAVGAMPPRHLRLTVALGGRMPGPLRRALVGAMRRVPGLAGYAPVFDFEHPADPFIRWGGFTRTEIERLCGQRVSFADTHFYRTFERFPHDAHFERYAALLDAMPSERVSQAMRIGSMRMRFPYCDRHVDTFLRSQPAAYRDRPGQPKRILRALLSRYLPKDVWDVPKRGFNFPLQRFLMHDDARLVRQGLDAARWHPAALLDADEVARHARAYLAGDHRRLFRVWALVVLGGWLEQHAGLH